VIARSVEEYLRGRGIPYRSFEHPRAVTAQETAQAQHVTGWRVVKCVAAEVDGRIVLCALPAPDIVDLDALCDLFGTSEARICEERELASLFPGSELGAAPPFGGLYGLPVVMDRSLLGAPALLLNAGSHETLVEVSTQDFLQSERPRLGSIGALPGATWRHAEDGEPVPSGP
jgi:Ala-tRNA(Pro) deacylase